MKVIKSAYKGFLSLFNYPCISQELLNELKGPLLLHVSDTPVDIYQYIFRIVDIVKPKYIVHTGDLADNIKLEIHKYKLDWYCMGVKKLVEGLEKSECSEVYYVMGNHDDYDSVYTLSERGLIINEGHLSIDGYNFNLGHYFKDANEVDFNLYGHSFEPGHFKKNGTMGLNGLLNINIIDLSNKKVFHLDYPIGTNGSRGMELSRIGL